ncbi:MAG TPA: hypothetical protein VHV83_05720, partial [Armatimonadota bacterium]|nr:hypothetical protein [Armatimonadota bacterium]
MRTHVVILSVCWSLLVIWVSAVFCQGPTPQDMVYLEAEQALPNGWHAVQTTPSASGGKNIGWFEQGKTLILPLTVPALSDGVLYVRYSRGEKTQSGLAVAITRPDTPRAEFSQAKQIGVMPCDPTRNYGTYTWQSIALGQLAAGNYWLLLSPQGEKASVNIDAVIVIDDHWHRLWSPANVYKDGKAVDAGKILPAVNWNADSTAFRGVYSPGDAITFTVTAANRSSLPVNFALPWEIVDFSGKSIATGKIATALPAGGNDQKSVTLARSLPQGWYAVRFSPADGPAERLFVVMPAMQEKDRKASRFGINTHGADGKEDYAMMARLGVGWLRGLTNWHFVQGSNVQPWQDKPYNWKDGDTNLAYSEAYGLQRMGSLAFSVAWASSTDPATKNWWGASTYPPDDLTPNGPYASYIKKMVERYHDHVQ